MTVQSIADITPNGAAVALGTGRAVWIILSAKTGNGADIRVGDNHIGAAQGARIPAGTSLLLPRCDFDQGNYDLSQVEVYGAAGTDSVSVTFGS